MALTRRLPHNLGGARAGCGRRGRGWGGGLPRMQHVQCNAGPGGAQDILRHIAVMLVLRRARQRALSSDRRRRDNGSLCELRFIVWGFNLPFLIF